MEKNAFLQLGEMRRMAAVGENKVILSVENELELTSEMIVDDGVTEYYIYGETIKPVDKICMTGGLLSANSIAASEAQFCMDGQPGADGTASTKYSGSSGLPGGNFSLYLEKIKENQCLKLQSNGGQGGAGGNILLKDSSVTEAGGNGGAGGEGGQLQVFCRHPYSDFQEQIGDLLTLDAQGEQKKRFGEFVEQLSKVEALSSYFKELQKKKDMNPMDIMEAGQYITLAGMELLDSIQCTSLGGRGGKGGEGYTVGKSGANGEGKKAELHCFSKAEDVVSLRQTNIMYAHPEQCEMLLRQIQLRFFVWDNINQPEEIEVLSEMMHRLIQRTEPFYQLPVDTPLARAYEDEGKIGAYNSIERLAAVYLQTMRLREYLLQGLDYMGRRRDYVPLLSFQSYQNSLLEMKGSVTSLEQLKNNYIQQEVNRTNQEKYFKKMREELLLSQNKIQDEINQLNIQLQNVQDKILFYEKKVNMGKPEIENLITRFQNAVKSKSNIELSKVISALSGVSSSPKDIAKCGLATMKIFVKDITGFDDNKGKAIKREYIVGKMQEISLSLDGLQEGYQQQQDRGISIADPGADKLLATRSAVESVLEEIDNKIKNESRELREGFDTFVNYLIERNNAIVEYNSVLGQLQQKEEELQIIQDKSKRLTDENYQALCIQCQGDYGVTEEIIQNARMLLLDAYQKALKSYNFWALKPGALKMSDIVEKDNIWDISMESMENALMNLRKEYRHAVEESSVSLDNRQGISLELDESQIEDIRRDGNTIIDVCPEIFCGEDCENPFSGMYDVRVKGVKVLLDNLQFAGTNQKVRVSVTQMGEEKCMDRSKTWHTFHHEPCITLYEYDVVDGKETIDGALEDQRSKSWEESRALIGPFAKWKITIQGSANKKMDYSRITGGRIEFLICFRPL